MVDAVSPSVTHAVHPFGLKARWWAPTPMRTGENARASATRIGLLLDWPAANQWVFVRAIGRPRLLAVSRIAQ
jgi:hypothetical protein